MINRQPGSAKPFLIMHLVWNIITGQLILHYGYPYQYTGGQSIGNWDGNLWDL